MNHKMKGFVRWSTWSYDNIVDVRKIDKVFIRKRVFCIFDKDYPYVIDIFYKPNLNSWNIFNLDLVKFYQYRSQSFRYNSEQRCKKDFDDIISKIEILKNIET